jgi:uncharacterized membrane protein
MGTVGRLSHHSLVSRKRTYRKRSSARRVPNWPHHPLAEGSSRLDAPPSTLMVPLAETPLSPRMKLAAVAGQVHVGEVIDLPDEAGAQALAAQQAAAAEDRARANSVMDMPLPTLTFAEPLQWLLAGWRDFAAAPWIGLLYGSFFVAMSWMLLGTLAFAPAYTLALSAGFLLLGPFLCLGLYQTSRSLAHGRRPRLWSSLTAWRVAKAPLAIFACVLLVLEMLWGRSAMIVFAISFDGVPDFGAPLDVLLSPDYLVFYASYGAVSLLFGGLIFAISVISIPMIMDRGVDAISAGLASMRLFTTQMGVMMWWGFLIAALVALALLPAFMGLLVVGPVLGHASWHAYRAATRLAPPVSGPDAQP